ncbi:hypothetical protein RI054_05g27680 [Pseudoscourfieldia marina]
MLLHYPSLHSEKHGGYVTEDGHATDDTTRMTNEATANVQMEVRKAKYDAALKTYYDEAEAASSWENVKAVQARALELCDAKHDVLGNLTLAEAVKEKNLATYIAGNSNRRRSPMAAHANLVGDDLAGEPEVAIMDETLNSALSSLGEIGTHLKAPLSTYFDSPAELFAHDVLNVGYPNNQIGNVYHATTTTKSMRYKQLAFALICEPNGQALGDAQAGVDGAETARVARALMRLHQLLAEPRLMMPVGPAVAAQDAGAAAEERASQQTDTKTMSTQEVIDLQTAFQRVYQRVVQNTELPSRRYLSALLKASVVRRDNVVTWAPWPINDDSVRFVRAKGTLAETISSSAERAKLTAMRTVQGSLEFEEAEDAELDINKASAREVLDAFWRKMLALVMLSCRHPLQAQNLPR